MRSPDSLGTCDGSETKPPWAVLFAIHQYDVITERTPDRRAARENYNSEPFQPPEEKNVMRWP